MFNYFFLLAFLVVAVTGARLDYDQVLYKLSKERYGYVRDPDGNPHLVDLWVKVSDVLAAARYSPDTENEYHLFTRSNPTVSQPIVLNNVTLLNSTNYDASKRTVVLIHGWMNSATSDMFTVLVPAFLSAEDVNVVVVDWSAGASNVLYLPSVLNTVTSGVSVANFFNWICTTTGASPSNFHIAGHSLGGHQAGIVGRNLASVPAYVTAMDPALPGWAENDDKFQSTDGDYTEVIHTTGGVLGYLTPLGQVDFYPNGGVSMPGCLLPTCNHSRSYYYMAESVESGGFTGTGCDTYEDAVDGSCSLDTTLAMGGIEPKTGSSGIFYLETNADQPFSQG